MKQFKLLSSLRSPLYFSVFFGASAIFFSLSYLIMATLPGERDNMCVIGGGMTPGNIAFSALMSLAAGLVLAGYTNIIRSGFFRNKIAITSLSGSAFVLGIFTLFCTLCTIPLISFFGISIALWFFSQYVFLVQIVSLLFMGLALFLMECQLRGICFTPSIKQILKRKFLP